jgi:hypothetical protein
MAAACSAVCIRSSAAREPSQRVGLTVLGAAPFRNPDQVESLSLGRDESSEDTG